MKPTVLPRRRAQHGTSLVFALMALVILGLGAMALTRSVDTGTLVMGNLSFRQDAVVTSSAGTEQALAWLQSQDSATLDATDAGRGYYSASIETLDPAGNRTSAARPRPLVDWNGDGCAAFAKASFTDCATRPASGTPVNGNRVQWVIIRMCALAGQPPAGANFCLRPAGSADETVAERGELQPGGRFSRPNAGPFYRVIVRVQGPRNTVSITETMVSL